MCQPRSLLMPRVFIPPALQPLVDGKEFVEAEGQTIRQLINDLDDRFPGLKQQLCEANELRPGISVAVGNSVSSLGLLQRVDSDDEIHFLPSIGGGC